MSAIVVLPGLAATGRFLQPFLDDLGADHEVSVLELPGHGDQRCEPEQATLDEAADRLRDRLGKPAILLGWSLGASVAYRCLQRHGTDGVLALVSVEQSPRLLTAPQWPYAAFGGLDPDGVAQLRRQVEDDYPAFARTLVRASFAAGAEPDPALEAELLAEAGRCDPRAVSRLLADATAADFRAAVRGFALPTLVVHGALSQVYPPAVGAWLAAAFPRARSVLLPGCGHLPFREQPAAFADTIRSFVAEIAPHQEEMTRV